MDANAPTDTSAKHSATPPTKLRIVAGCVIEAANSGNMSSSEHPPATTTTTTTTTKPTTTTTAAPGTITYSYAIKGSSEIKRLHGTVPIRGGITAKLDLGTSRYTADLALDPTSARFAMFGFIPVTTKIAFQPQGPTTGAVAKRLLAELPNIRRAQASLRARPSFTATEPQPK